MTASGLCIALREPDLGREARIDRRNDKQALLTLRRHLPGQLRDLER